MKRNFFKLLLSAVLMMCCMVANAVGTQPSGEGTSRNPYQIATKIGNIYYILDDANKTAAVTYGNMPTPEYRLSIEIPSEVLDKDTKYTVTSVTEYAFADCPDLQMVTLPSTITSIGEYAFANCPMLGNVDMPSTITSIGMFAFSDCPSLRSIIIPDGVTSIGIGTFRNCTRLESIVIPGNVTSIEGGAFLGCSGLTSVSISEGVESIGTGAFSDCSSLILITIPSSVTSIKHDLFQGCINLTSVIVLATNPPTLDGDVDVELSFPVYVPNVQAYANWGGFANIRDLDDYKPDAIADIYNAMQGEKSSTYLNGLVQNYLNAINNSDDYAVINKNRVEAIGKLNSVISTYKEIKTAELGDLGTEKPGPAVKVTKGDKEVILYAPEKVEYIIRK